MSSDRRLIGVASETYVYAEVDPQDLQKTATSVMQKLAGFRSYTYLHPFEDVDPADAPEDIRAQFEAGTLQRQMPTDEPGADDEGEDPVDLRFAPGQEPQAGMAVCRLDSITYVAMDTAKEDVERTWLHLRALLSSPYAVSVATPDVHVIPFADAPEDIQAWVLYGASDRVVIPLWPEDYIDEPERLMDWKEAPYRAEPREEPSGSYIKVVAVDPPHTRGMLCRMWHQRRDESSGIGTVRGKYPVNVAVAVPTEKRTPHIHSFHSVETRDWRPGLVFYTRTDEDGCPLSYLDERLEKYQTAKEWVPEKTWRAWLKEPAR